MSLTVDYLPFATQSGANVEPQASYVGSGAQQLGFSFGLIPAPSEVMNKVWRQSSMIAAAIANLISQRLSINVLDDGNLTNLVTELSEAFGQEQVVDSNVTPVSGGVSSTSFFTLMGYTIPASVWYVGKQYRIRAAGTIQLGAAGSATLAFASNGAQSDPALAVSSSGLANSNWIADIIVSCLVTGSSGELLVSGKFTTDTPGSGAVTPGDSTFLVNLFVNLSLPYGVAIGGLFGSSLGTNEMTEDLLIVEALN